MKEFNITVKDKNGLHARPAGLLATLSRSFESDISVEAGDKKADGKRLLSLMSLGAKHGTVLHFKITGIDEDVAEKAIKDHCEKELGE